jgi:uncharacterized iron-regulated protein
MAAEKTYGASVDAPSYGFPLAKTASRGRSCTEAVSRALFLERNIAAAKRTAVTYAVDVDAGSSQHARMFEPDNGFRARKSARGFLALARLSWFALAAIGCSSDSQLHPDHGFALHTQADHPLLGKIFAAKSARLVSVDQLNAALDQAAFAIMGETHDNPDHHALQAKLLDRFLASHAKAHVAFEMLDEDQASALVRPFSNADQIGARVNWQRSGWPSFELYRPIFESALRGHAQLLAAHPSRAHVLASMQGIPEDQARRLHLAPALPAQVQAAQREETQTGHCGHAPNELVAAMQNAQNYKDAFMARAITQAGAPSVLIAGRGHARKDRGVPLFAARFGGAMLSIAFIEVEAEHLEASDYDVAAYDFSVFTPRVDSADPCEKFRKQLQELETQPNGRTRSPSTVSTAPEASAAQ